MTNHATRLAEATALLHRARAWGNYDAPHSYSDCALAYAPDCPACALRVRIDRFLAASTAPADPDGERVSDEDIMAKPAGTVGGYAGDALAQAIEDNQRAEITISELRAELAAKPRGIGDGEIQAVIAECDRLKAEVARAGDFAAMMHAQDARRCAEIEEMRAKLTAERRVIVRLPPRRGVFVEDGQIIDGGEMNGKWLSYNDTVVAIHEAGGTIA